jgi:exopolyphosphatase/guanosine-5'-triphosphate,3'-diphosphate pyrophosphatase
VRLSAIDQGSNAVRMIVAEWHGDRFEILKKYRVPLRLGADVFDKGEISPPTIKKAEECYKDFAEINHKMNVVKCRAVATSASREAKNRDQFLKVIKVSTGIDLEVIDGLKEAELVFEAVKHQVNLKQKNALLIDVGGGSVEVTFVHKGQIHQSQSFPLGTLRLLQHLRSRKMSESHIRIALGDLMRPVVDFFDRELSGVAFDLSVGTGGNLESMARLKTQLLFDLANESVLTNELQSIFDKLIQIPLQDRIEFLELRADRADVIVPATAVVEMILRQAGIDKISIPGVGLRDGLLYSMI